MTGARDHADRLERAGRALARGISLLRAAGEPGHAEPGELAADLAAILRARLGPVERVWLAGTAGLACPPDARLRICDTLAEDAALVSCAETEKRRQELLRQWGRS